MLARHVQNKKEQQSDFVQCYSVGLTKPENSKYIIETWLIENQTLKVHVMGKNLCSLHRLDS